MKRLLIILGLLLGLCGASKADGPSYYLTPFWAGVDSTNFTLLQAQTALGIAGGSNSTTIIAGSGVTVTTNGANNFTIAATGGGSSVTTNATFYQTTTLQGGANNLDGLDIFGTTNNYFQVFLQNLSAGNSASASFIVGNDQSSITDLNHILEWGVNSSTYNLNIFGGPGDGFIGNGLLSTNLYIQSGASYSHVKIGAGGVATNNYGLDISSTLANFTVPITTTGVTNTGLTASSVTGADANKKETSLTLAGGLSLTSGTLSSANSTNAGNIAFLNGTNAFSGTNNFIGIVDFTGAYVYFTDNLDIGNGDNIYLTNGVYYGFGSGSFVAGATGGFTGNGANLTNLNATQLTSGTVPQAQLPTTMNAANLGGATLNATNLGGTVASARLGSGGSGNGTNYLSDAGTFVTVTNITTLGALVLNNGTLSASTAYYLGPKASADAVAKEGQLCLTLPAGHIIGYSVQTFGSTLVNGPASIQTQLDVNPLYVNGSATAGTKIGSSTFSLTNTCTAVSTVTGLNTLVTNGAPVELVFTTPATTTYAGIYVWLSIMMQIP